MNTPISESDFIQLNAYLDGELSAGELEAFERRLQQEPALQAELESLRVTVTLIGMAERVPLPRHFTLDPAVYARPARSGLFQRLIPQRLPALATAGAMIVLVAILAGAFLWRSWGVRGAPTMVAEAPVAQEAAEEPMAEEAAPTEEVYGTDMTDTEPPLEAPMPEEPAMAAEAEETEEPLAEQPPWAEGGGGGEGDVGGEMTEEPEEELPPPTLAAAPTIAPSADDTPRPTPIPEEKIAGGDETENIARTEIAAVQETPSMMVTRGPRIFETRTGLTVAAVVVVGLLALLVGLGVVIVIRLRRES